ncbi:hypothetical protein GCM10007140_11540 [Priestia taiwanensis]|uniref:Uncharacterized protein n=1 Tax=Priestia taiwanensis TaxID=1347902 RepID=A0A917EPK2_9BACI|nr:hypothetical protein GCM10007140_11540 [Priestia taiwanensis]
MKSILSSNDNSFARFLVLSGIDTINKSTPFMIDKGVDLFLGYNPIFQNG